MTPEQIDRLETLRQRRSESEEDRVRELAEQAELEELEREAEAEAAIERDRRQEQTRQAERARLRAIDEPHPSGARLRINFNPQTDRMDSRHPWRAVCSHGVTIAAGVSKDNAIGELLGVLESDPALAAALAAEVDDTETTEEEQSNAA